MKNSIIGVLGLITVSCTKQTTETETGFFSGLTWQSSLFIIITLVILFWFLPLLIKISQERKSKKRTQQIDPPQYQDTKKGELHPFFSIAGKAIKGLFDFILELIKKIFAMPAFRPVLILFIIWLCLLIKRDLLDSELQREGGFFGAVSSFFTGKTKQDRISEKNVENFSQPKPANPNVQYKWDKKLEIEIEENRHEEEMAKIKQQSSVKTSSNTTPTNTGMQVGTGTISGPAPDMSSANNAWNNNPNVEKNQGMQVGTGTIGSPPN